jgi:MoaA/NifB/PqqE/SkfB family radical SAM enzyme
MTWKHRFDMVDTLTPLPPDSTRIDFGAVSLSDAQQRFYRRFNEANVTLCGTLPDAVRQDALVFLKRYSGMRNNQRLDFYKNYYPPAWSIIYWLVHRDRRTGSRLTAEDVTHAVAAHAMAMNLHSLDDHINDGEVPANHLTLLLRSQSWMMMNTSLGRLAARVDGGEGIVRDFLNDYYAGIHRPEACASLDSYCERFRKQMATWVITPVLISNIMDHDDTVTAGVQSAYESFGIAWRLLDDIHDIAQDMAAGVRTAVYHCLTDDMKGCWAVPSSNADPGGGDSRQHALNEAVVQVRQRAISELEAASAIAGSIQLQGLGNEFCQLAGPLAQGSIELAKSDLRVARHGIPDRRILSIEVSTRCNAKCAHCFVRAGLERQSELTPQAVSHIISEGYALGYRHLHLTGGEPLMWAGLLDALDTARALGYESILVNTNGTLITEEMAGRLSGIAGLKLSVSIEGRAPLHDDIRGPGSYLLATKGLDQALAAGIPVTVFTTLRKRLLPYLGHFVDEVYERFPDIRQVALIQLIRVRGDGLDLADELLTPDDFIRAVQGASLLNVYGHRTAFLNNPLANVASQRMGIWGIPPSAPLRCQGDLVVMADQTVAAAHSMVHRIGRYAHGGLKRLLSSPGYLAAVAPDVVTCRDCSHRRLCVENGMVRPSPPYRDMHPDVPFCKRVLNRAAAYSLDEVTAR